MDARALEHSWFRVRRLAERYPDQFGGEDLLGQDPLQIFASARRPQRVLVVTSAAALKRWKKSDWPEDLVIIVAAGKLSRAQANLIGRLAANGAAPIAFVGDADAMGLHTFLSLRIHLGAKRVRFCGICDAVLDVVGDDRAQPETLLARDLTEFDRAHLRIVASKMRPEKVLGPRVAAVLVKGKKIPIAALGFRADLLKSLFRAALTLAGRP